MKKLIHGIVEFRKNLAEGQKALFVNLASGQKPDALLIACSDSRVVPNLFASTDPGVSAALDIPALLHRSI